MKLNDYKLIFAVVGLISVLLFATPVIGIIIGLPSGESYSELLMLGPDHIAQNYPFNIVTNQNYSIYIDVFSHMNSSSYCALNLKLLNDSDTSPNATLGTPSSTQPFNSIKFFQNQNTNWERKLTFSIPNLSTSMNQSAITNLRINDLQFDLQKPNTWDNAHSGFYYQLLIELWIYNTKSSSFEYTGRFVNLPLNVTQNII
jgi:uncharacterized membrane protein